MQEVLVQEVRSLLVEPFRKMNKRKPQSGAFRFYRRKERLKRLFKALNNLII
jgi:hypothetical protein